MIEHDIDDLLIGQHGVKAEGILVGGVVMSEAMPEAKKAQGSKNICVIQVSL